MFRRIVWWYLACGLLVSIAGGPTLGQVPAESVDGGRLVVRDVRFESLAGNLLGDPAARSVTVYLPPSYDGSDRRYPVVYLLHGVGDTDARWRDDREDRGIESIMDNGVAAGEFGEMIVVMPSAGTSFLGGMYTDSPVHGNLEHYITSELVDHIDSNYRTLADRTHRGVAGHSMGGYAAIRYGMRHADTFSVVYAMNAAGLGWHSDLSHENWSFYWITQIDDVEALWETQFWNIALISAAQAWSPDVANPPFYARMPFTWDRTVPHMVPVEPYHSMWEANMPLSMLDEPEVQAHLRSLRGLRFDTAFEDEFTHIPPTNRALSERLTALGIDHVFEMYNGNHRDRLTGPEGRLRTEVLPYMWRLLREQDASVTSP